MLSANQPNVLLLGHVSSWLCIPPCHVSDLIETLYKFQLYEAPLSPVTIVYPMVPLPSWQYIMPCHTSDLIEIQYQFQLYQAPLCLVTSLPECSCILMAVYSTVPYIRLDRNSVQVLAVSSPSLSCYYSLPECSSIPCLSLTTTALTQIPFSISFLSSLHPCLRPTPLLDLKCALPTLCLVCS